MLPFCTYIPHENEENGVYVFAFKRHLVSIWSHWKPSRVDHFDFILFWTGLNLEPFRFSSLLFRPYSILYSTVTSMRRLGIQVTVIVIVETRDAPYNNFENDTIFAYLETLLYGTVFCVVSSVWCLSHFYVKNCQKSQNRMQLLIPCWSIFTAMYPHINIFDIIGIPILALTPIFTN